MRLKPLFTSLSALGLKFINMLNLNMSELLGDTSAVEEGGVLYGPMQAIKSVGGGVTLICAAILIVLAVVCVSIYAGGIMINHNNPSEMQGKKRSFAWLVFAILLAAGGVGLVIWVFTNGQVFSNKMLEETTGTALLNMVSPMLRA